jgi:hypothetical protein
MAKADRQRLRRAGRRPLLAAVVAVLSVASAAQALTLGGTTTGTLDSGDSNYLNGSRVTVGALAAQVSAMSVYVGNVDAAPYNQYQVAIYADAGGVPGALLASSGSATLTPNTWNTAPISAALQANAAYWLMYNTNGRTAALNDMSYVAGSASQGAYRSASAAFGTWPATFGAATLTNAVYALYATATTGTPAPTPSATATATAGAPGTPTAAPTATATGGDPRSSVGEWSAVMAWPLVAIHAALLKTGKVLFFDDEFGVTHPMLWDPATLALTNTPAVNNELFCAGQTQLADGRLLVVGGHQPNVNEGGINTTYTYLPDTDTWVRTGDMAYKRWYPAITRLGDGRVAIFSGQITQDAYADTAEIFDPATGAVSALSAIVTPELHEEEYPASFHLPTGKLLAISPEHGPVQSFDGDALTWTAVNTTPIHYGSAVQYRPGRILMAGGGMAFFTAALGQAAVLDMNAPLPAWRAVASMTYPRYMHNLVMLPTGDVLAVGGATQVDQQSASGVLPIERWSPASETWTTLAPLRDPRMYHSTALLLPDGRVLAAGGGHNANEPNYYSAQVFSPPYLFAGARPTITSAPAAVSYGQGTFTVATPNAATIASVSLIALGAATHSNDMNQFYAEPAFTVSTGQLTVAAPATGGEMPPGYYMLFIIDQNGVPSVAAMLEIGGVLPATPTPSPTPQPSTATVTRTSTPDSPTASATSSATAAGSPTSTATGAVATATASRTVTASATRSATPTVSATPSAVATATASPTAGAVPPPLGLTAVGGTADGGDSNYLNGSKVTTAAGGKIVSMSVYVGAIDSNAANRSYQLAIYADSAGRPGALVASSASGTLVANAWNTMAISTTLQANTSYWLIFNTNGRSASVNDMRYNAGVAGQGTYSTSGVPFGTWPATFPAASLTNAAYSIYATFGP